jgi:hypothetical protein
MSLMSNLQNQSNDTPLFIRNAVSTCATLSMLITASIAYAQTPAGTVVQSGAITNPASQLCLDVARASADDGLNVQLGSCQNGTATWDLIDLGRGEYALINRLTKRSLDVAGGNAGDGTNIQQYAWNGSPAQRWRLTTLPNRAVQIVNVGNGKCLDISGRSFAAGSNIAQWQCHGGDNQQWLIGGTNNFGAPPPTPPAPSGAISVGGERPTGAPPIPSASIQKPLMLPNTDSAAANTIKVVNGRLQGRTLYSGMIVSRNSNKCIDLDNARDADGTNIQQWTCNNTNAQLWDFLDAGNGEMVIMARASQNRVMDVGFASKDDNANIGQYTFNNNANQRWRLEPSDRGFFRIVSVNSSKCVDVNLTRGGMDDGDNISQWSCNGKSNQQWRIEIRGSGSGWSNFRAAPSNQADASYSDAPPAAVIGTWQGYNPVYQSTIRLTINKDGTALAEIDGNLRVNGYFRANRLYLGAERYDIQRDRRGFRTIQVGQSNNVVSYTRAR